MQHFLVRIIVKLHTFQFEYRTNKQVFYPPKKPVTHRKATPK